MSDASFPGSEKFEPPKYLASLIAAVNDGAKAAQAGARLFALVGVYLLATAFSASDEDLLRGRAVTISQIGASLPSASHSPSCRLFLCSCISTPWHATTCSLRMYGSFSPSCGAR